jgi:hypothetical protein
MITTAIKCFAGHFKFELSCACHDHMPGIEWPNTAGGACDSAAAAQHMACCCLRCRSRPRVRAGSPLSSSSQLCQSWLNARCVYLLGVGSSACCIILVQACLAGPALKHPLQHT